LSSGSNLSLELHGWYSRLFSQNGFWTSCRIKERKTIFLTLSTFLFKYVWTKADVGKSYWVVFSNTSFSL